MKNKIYYLGIATCLLITVGSIFKIMHWPGANVCIFASILLLCLGFIPFAFVSNYKGEDNKDQKNLFILAALILILNFISALFKIMHWPGGVWMILITMLLPFVVLLPAYLYYNRNEKAINYRNYLAILFFFAYFASITALLALNVQRSVIDSFIQSAISFEQKTDILTK